ncbi:glycerophosphodiester phosphodiesterase [Neobacillus sp. PS3-12]|jgi:glycerophosphoryl diester phosphodiesterase|uniref:glycerophosphodiester phosphodiesterase n=1 Tax=Neobacillus sp. PS3-12 TaxID=3070677 RepID=UPI0027E20EFC|nr:glycerophosphodiester phosphodiesterase [Neobacillus sp. PS3-12]WML53992.1 glycerophosphodiester phosphodiesterase [Neobacillus sp. PS3-12]
MTQVFAHRGYAASFAENTMKAFKEAEKAGADGIELDVQLTKDGEMVVIHDEKLNRTTNGNGFVKDFSYKEISKLNANKSGGAKEPIPLLKDVLKWMQGNRLICNIELKNGFFPYEGMEEKVIKLVRDYGLEERIIFSSFNHYSIVYCYRLAPEIEIAPLYSGRIFMPWIYAKSIQAKAIHPNYKGLTNDIIRKSIENGISVRPYTINNEEDMKYLFTLNCSAIITDDPVKALKLRKGIERDQ